MGKRILSLFLAVVMVLSCAPLSLLVHAEETTVKYVLDTSGKIEPGNTYLFVSGKGNALGVDGEKDKFVAMPIQGDTIYAKDLATNTDSLAAKTFEWYYEEGTLGLKNGTKYLNIGNDTKRKVALTGEPRAFSVANNANAAAKNGKYCVHSKEGTLLFYLYGYDNDKEFRFATTSKVDYGYGVSLYKKVGEHPGDNVTETGYTINFNGNGNTNGTAPAAVTVAPGEEYTFQPVDEEFSIVWGEDLYLFWCWTESMDGTGKEYRPGDTITVERDMALYAQWYKKNQYKVTVVTDLNDIPTDVNKILGEEVQLFVRLDQEGSPLLPLNRERDGVYTVTVTENGTYLVYAQHGGEEPEEEHGHKVIIYNQSGSTELLHYSVRYDANGGTFAQAPATKNYHANTYVTAIEEIPVLDGHRFLGWKDQNNNLIAPGDVVTEKLLEETVLTAQWEDLVDVTVQITVKHNGDKHEDDVHQILFNLLQQVGGVDMPVESVGKDMLLGANSADWGYTFDQATETATYQYTFKALPQGDYTAAATMSHYEAVVTSTGESNEDQQIYIEMIYNPDSFDLEFDVVVNHTEETKHLLPTAVNVRVMIWNGTRWQIIDRQGDGTPPVSVFIDENGRGHDFFPVWKNWGNGALYAYRVAVTSFVMPDGTVVRANSTQADQIYVPDGTGLYTATVTVENGGAVVNYPSAATLPGAIYDETAKNEQNGMPTVTVDIHPYTVTFEAGDGLLNKKQTVVLNNQYQYPDLRQYVPVPNEYDGVFTGWFVDGRLAENLAGQYLTGDVTYVAQYDEHMKLEGTVTVERTYMQDGEEVEVAAVDSIQKVLVVLQKNINGVYNDVDSCLVNISYGDKLGTGEYEFDHLVADGTQYRVYVLQHNYEVMYDNNADEVFGHNEYDAVFVKKVARVDLLLDMNPELYSQVFEVDARRIEKAFRPDSVKMQILYRDLGDILSYQVIAQHKGQQGGVTLNLNDAGTAAGIQSVWKWHNNVTLYEYQLSIKTLYGQVQGVFTQDGVQYSNQMPFTVQYSMPTYYNEEGEQPVLRATLVPKEYEIIFDMGLAEGEHVEGMDEYHTDTDQGERYSYHHTWSKTAVFDAYPYRDGYVFDGWTSSNDHVIITNGGEVRVPAELAEEITLTANWTPLTGNDCAIYHLEKNTNKVLAPTQHLEGLGVNSPVMALESVQFIKGYEYTGARVNGTYYDKSQDPKLVISSDPTKNQMVIYYIPDGSDGYTEQVEDNIHLSKQTVLEDDGTYTITMETYTKDNPITTQVLQNTPLDIVLVLDQSGSMNTYQATSSGYKRAVETLKESVSNFINLIADHGRQNQVDHRIAIVGYANGVDGSFSSSQIAGSDGISWANTGVFDSNGDFQAYSFNGFNYTPYTGLIDTKNPYYTKVIRDGKEVFLLLTHHDAYYHLMNAEDAKVAVEQGTTVYGYAYDAKGVGGFVELTRNNSGLWLYGDKQLYSDDDFYTYHQDVWTHRYETEAREIHGYGVGADYREVDDHQGVYVRTVTRSTTAQKNIYEDALMPVTTNANGAGNINPGLLEAPKKIGYSGMTYVSYGIEMANRVFAANPLTGDNAGRQRIVVVFTDGKPGDNVNFDDEEANRAIAQSYTLKNENNARVYTVGMYSGETAQMPCDQSFFMNGLSSNYKTATNLDDVWTEADYERVTSSGTDLNIGGFYYTPINGEQCKIKREARNGKHVWFYTNSKGQETVITSVAYGTALGYTGGVLTVDNKSYELYKKVGVDYEKADAEKYYTVAENQDELKNYFTEIVTEITTKITTEITLYDDTILRDIMGQGMVLTEDTQIVAYKQKGTYNAADKTVTWSGVNEEVARIEDLKTSENEAFSAEKANISYELPDGTLVENPETPYIGVYNLQSGNPTDPNGDNYHPHTVDITGYDFTKWYISETHTEGYKMVVTISRVEARDDVVWGRSTTTNHEQSGLWLPMKNNERQLLLPFDQPTTIFVERAYVLDYGKEFTLTDWYFDDDGEKNATPVHLDCDVENGMNYFDPEDPNIRNSKTSPYGNTKYGNVKVEATGDVTYTPTTMNWGGYDQFLVFGNTWRKTVVAQDANENGNLWNKVTVIPANNIYYEDSFQTTENTVQNGIEGFTFTGTWETVTSGKAGENVEHPELVEDSDYGNVHGWTDALADDKLFTDGSAMFTKEKDAMVEFTFTGTGVDVYTRTNSTSGMVIAVLSKPKTDAEGNTTLSAYKYMIMDNLAVSGDYYQIPTVSFHKLPHGTYTLQIMVMKASDAQTGDERVEYYVDGVRIYNPMGTAQNYNDTVLHDAYGKEINAMFTEVRDILLDYGNFNPDMNDSTDGTAGAVFIDQIKDGQGAAGDVADEATYTYDIGTFEKYGPKNEVYLSPGQAIVLKVNEANTYFVGLKSLTGSDVTVNVSGRNTDAPTKIHLGHTGDLYYQVTPIDGYIVIQNGGETGIVSVTKLRTTNMLATVTESGVLSVTREAAIMTMDNFTRQLALNNQPQPDEPVEEIVDPSQQIMILFASVRTWLKEDQA